MRFSHSSAARFIAVAVLPLFLLSRPAPVSGADTLDWNISKRSESQIVDLAAKLADRFAEYPHLQQEPAVILLRSNVWDATPRNHRVIRNEVVRLVDPDYRDAATRTLQLNPDSDLKYREAWILRDGAVIRLKKDVWNIIKGDEEKAMSVIVAFPDVRAGDLLGWTVEEHCSWFWTGGYIEMAGDLPVMTCQTRIKTNGSIGYKSIAEHLLRDKWSSKIIEQSHQAPSDFSLTVVDIPRRPTGRYAPNDLEYCPYVQVVYRGFWLEEASRWIGNVSWNEVAIEGSALLEELEKQEDDVEHAARSAVAGATSPREMADAVHRHIRDDFVLLDPFLVRSRKDDLRSLLVSRQATRWEKGALMYTLCRALGLEVDLLAGRGSFLSPIDKAKAGEPAVYYVPQDERCAPGDLPPYLRGVEAFEIPRGVGKRGEALQKEAFKNIGLGLAGMWDEYCRLVKLEDLEHWVTLPGDPDELMATTDESLIRVAGQDTLAVQLRLSGHSDLQFDVRRGGDGATRLADYLATRFENLAVLQGVYTPMPPQGGDARLNGMVRAEQLPAPSGGDWVLPGEMVFGRVFLDDWDAAAREPFIGRVVESRRYDWRAPLPDGWASATAPAPFAVDHPQFAYRCRFAIEDGFLVAIREILIRRAITMHADLSTFNAALTRVQDHERSPVIVTRN